MNEFSSTRRVAVVGAGAAGTLAAVQLVRQAGAAGVRLELWLVDPGEWTGRGVAYGTGDRRHVLNVPAAKMSALPDDADHFLRWLRVRHPGVLPGDFVARGTFGGYLADVLQEAVDGAPGVRLHRVRERVVDARVQGRGLVVLLGSGARLRVDAGVLALGGLPPSVEWACGGLRASGRFVADPWAAGALERVAEGGDVLLVGTGLTMADVAVSLARPGRVVHAVSRNGLVPQEHLAVPAAPAAPAVLDGSRGLDVLRRDVRRHLAATRRACGDWRPGLDGLRPVTARLWQQLSGSDRARFFREDLRAWEVHRHRLAPRTAAAVRALRAGGGLRVSAGRVVRTTAVEGGLEVVLSDGRVLRVGAVVNCTGAQSDLRRSVDPLVRGLLARGEARPGPAGLGFDTCGDGRLLAAEGPAPRLWTLGAARRGNLLETTAIPEIRAQAAEVAASVLDVCAPRGVRRPRDRFGLALSTTPRVAQLYDRALGRVLAGRVGAQELLVEAVAQDPDFAVGLGALALIGHECAGAVDVSAVLARAERAAVRRADARERSLVAAVRARVAGSEEEGRAALLGHIGAYPRDALVVSAAVPTVSFSGVTSGQESWRLVEGLVPVYGDDWWFLGQLAFVRQEQERWQEAEALCVRALEAHPAAGHAVHARAHVFYETGEHRAGLAWLDGWSGRYGARAGHRSHVSWHAALHELTLDDGGAVLRRFGRELTASRVGGGRLLVDSVALLWRARMAGCWQGPLPVEELVGAAPRDWWEAPATGFAALHGAVALAAAGDVEGLERLRRFGAVHRQEVFRGVVVPLCEALSAVVRGSWGEAAVLLGPLVGSVARVGASRAQCEVVEETLLFALVAGGELGRARGLLEARLERRASPLDRRRLGAVVGGSGVRGGGVLLSR
ncbi:FAD/NAD(P)-binding protein [Streptomyces sp. NPDC001904]|uniref:FAD/NAD(P)-binding protein n=1 Tax=Streptomyces sp. NPDC001904 TaxID=3154531 RepID=UPI00331FC0CE